MATDIIATPAPPRGIRNTVYAGHDFDSNTSGGTAPYTYAVTAGSLPTGLALNGATGVLSGTPTVAGTFNFTIQATDVGAVQDSQAFTIIVEAIVICSPASPATYELQTVNMTANVPGGSWQSVPSGHINSSTGVFTAPDLSTVSVDDFTVTYTTLAGQTCSQVIHVEQELTIAPTAQIIGSGGVLPVSMSVPATLSATCGSIAQSGAPSMSGSYIGPSVSVSTPCVVTATSPGGQTATANITVEPIMINATPSTIVTQDDAVITITVVGGTAPYTPNSPTCGVIASTANPNVFTFTANNNTNTSIACNIIFTDAALVTVTVPVTVYPNLTVGPAYSGAETCLHMNTNSLLQLVPDGGSEQYIYSINGGGSISESAPGLYLSGSEPGNVIVTVQDNVTGVQATISICVEGPTTCVVAEFREEAVAAVRPCCETSVDCGENVYLSVPSFVVSSGPTFNMPPSYKTINAALAGEQGELTSLGAGGGAAANVVPVGGIGEFSFLVTPTMLSATTDTKVGWSNPNAGLDQIDFAIGINAAGNVQAWRYGMSVGTFGAAAVAGEELKLKVTATAIEVYRQGTLIYTFVDGLSVTDNPCGELELRVLFGQASTVIGGPAAATWSLQTPGSPLLIGTISANGRYTAGSRGGDIIAVATLANGSAVLHYITVTEPTLISVDPNEIWSSGVKSVWFNVEKLRAGQKPVLAHDGSPAKHRSPNALGFFGDYTVDGVTFDFKRTSNEIKVQAGTIDTEETNISVDVKFRFAQNRNANFIALFNPNAKVSRIGGAVQAVVGPQRCTSQKFNMLLVKESRCDTGKYDTFYVPTAKVTSGQTLVFKRGEIVSHEVTVTGYVDLSCGKGILYIQTLEQDCSGASGCE